MDRTDASTLAGEIFASSYANILKEKGFSMFLFNGKQVKRVWHFS